MLSSQVDLNTINLQIFKELEDIKNRSPFYVFEASDAGENFDWKFHVSVRKEDYQKAMDLLLPILLKQSKRFKIVDPEKVHRLDKPRFDNGSQVTIYPSNPPDTLEIVRELITEMHRVLSEAGIQPGKSESDLASFSPYVSMRNDFVNGDYVPAKLSGKNYDLENNGNPFEALAGAHEKFDPVKYFDAFTIDKNSALELYSAIRYTCLASIRPFIEITNDGVVIKEAYKKSSLPEHQDILVGLYIYNNIMSGKFDLKNTEFSKLGSADSDLSKAGAAIDNYLKTSPIAQRTSKEKSLNELIFGNPNASSSSSATQAMWAPSYSSAHVHIDHQILNEVKKKPRNSAY